MRDRVGAEDMAARWRELAARIRIGGPMPTRFEFSPHEEFGLIRAAVVRVRVIVSVADSRSGAIVTVTHEGLLTWGEPDPARLRELARVAWMHELDEFFLLDGHRVFDPHEGEDADGQRIARPARGQA